MKLTFSGSAARVALPLTAVLAAVALAVLAGCGGSDDTGSSDSTEAAASIDGLAIDTCGDVEYGGDGDADG